MEASRGGTGTEQNSEGEVGRLDSVLRDVARRETTLLKQIKRANIRVSKLLENNRTLCCKQLIWLSGRNREMSMLLDRLMGLEKEKMNLIRRNALYEDTIETRGGEWGGRGSSNSNATE